ncbi:hypothetical protein ACOME3_004947 [Neoechinorhynchus agilis]
MPKSLDQEDMMTLSVEENDTNDEWESNNIRVTRDLLKFDDQYVIYSFPRYLADYLVNSLNGESTGLLGHIWNGKFVISDKIDNGQVPQEYPLDKPIPMKGPTLVAKLGITNSIDDDYQHIESFEIIGSVSSRVTVKSNPLDDMYLGLKQSKYKRDIPDDDQFIYTYPYAPKRKFPITENRRRIPSRRERDNENNVKEMILKCFSERRYYTMNELVEITDQPYQYLKSILSDLCIYHTGECNRNKYELRPEYSQYSIKE